MTSHLEQRMTNPAALLPDVMTAVQTAGGPGRSGW